MSNVIRISEKSRGYIYELKSLYGDMIKYCVSDSQVIEFALFKLLENNSLRKENNNELTRIFKNS